MHSSEHLDNYSDHLGSTFFSKEIVDKKPVTVWILAALGLILGIRVVAGLGLMTPVAAVSSSPIFSSVVRMAGPPLHAGLPAVLTLAFVRILFMVHRARQAAWHEPVRGFAGFAGDVQD